MTPQDDGPLEGSQAASTAPDAATPRALSRPIARKAAHFIVSARWLWVALTIAAMALAVARIDQIWPLDPNARVFFAPENPDRQALDKFEATFAKDDNLLIVITPEGGKVFTPDVLGAIGEITEQAWLLPFVRRVDSITNFQHTYAEGDEMIVRDLVADPPNVTADEAADARKIALSRIEMVNFSLTKATDVTLVQVRFTLPQTNPATEVPSIVAAAKELRTTIEAKYPFLDLRFTGAVMINNQFSVSGQEDGKNLMGPMFVIILLIVGIALRSFFGTLSVLVVITISAISGLGALGWMGLPLNSVTILAPLYIMTLAVASAVHILASCRQTMVLTADRKEWARQALENHMVAIIIACVTTAIGFFCLNFSISPPFRQLGNIVGIGILAAMVFTLTLLPALVTFLPIRRQTTQAVTNKWMGMLAEFVIAKRTLLLPGTVLLVVGLAVGVSQIRLEDDFLRYFDERYEFRQDTDYTEAHLTGVSGIEFPLPSGAAQGVNNPVFLKEVSAFADWLRAQGEVTYVNTLTDTIKRLNMNMHSDDEAFMRIPDTREEASQYLFLYELSISYGMDLTDRIDVDRSTMRVTVLMANVTTASMRALTLRAGDWLNANAPTIQAAWKAENPAVRLVTPTGVVHVFNLISYRDVRSMLVGTLIALFLISGIITVALWNLRVGLVSLVPNLIPGLMAFGIWGYSVGAVTLAIAVVLAATLGVVVDDTVHFLSKYTEARKRGEDAEDSVRYAFKSVGMAMLVTTVGLVGGFGVLAQSGFAVNGDMAKLTALTISLALVADFFLLPSLLIWLEKRKPTMTNSGSKSATAAATLAILLTGAFLLPKDAAAATPEEKGLAIAIEADKRDLGFGDFTTSGEMVLRDKQGKESRRVFRSLTKERLDPNLGDLGVIVFAKPRDIRGTALLTHANIEPKDDDQWIFLPAVKRVKRISSSNRTGKFVSSEFSYEDLGSQEIGDYAYKWLRDEPCPTAPALTCFVSESFPKNKKSGYSKRLSWIDTAEYRIQTIQFFNRRGDLEKQLTFSGYAQYLGKYWRAAKMNMINKQTGKSTDLLWTNYKFGTGLAEGDFDANRLKRLAR